MDEASPRTLVLIWSGSEKRFPDFPDLDFASALNLFILRSGRADIVLHADDFELPAGWIAALASAAAVDDVVAGAGPMWVSRGLRAPELRGDFLALHPRNSNLNPACCYIRRSALDLIGAFCASETPEGALTDWCARTQAAGLGFRLADDLRLPAIEFEPGDPLSTELGPLRRALSRERQVGRAKSVTIDARSLANHSGGTQSYTAALVLAVTEHTDFSVRVVRAHDAPAEIMRAFREAGVEILSYEQAIAGVRPTDLLHLPHQVFDFGDLNLARLLSDRLIVSHLDLIAFHNRSYHESEAAWLNYRRMTRIGMTIADRVIFTSPHALADAVSEELLEPDRAAVAGIGVSPIATDAPRRRPAAVKPEAPFLLMLGADYSHKNRVFALHLLRALREHHAFTGGLIFAGRHMDRGATVEQEKTVLAGAPELDAVVTDLGSVSEAEKNWLLDHALALVSPSTYEGYGLTPLEAAAAAKPCIYAAVSAHADVLGSKAATIVPWDVKASADLAAPLLVPGSARDWHLRQMRTALERSGWPQVAQQIGDAYEAAISGPYQPAAQIGWQHYDLEREVYYLRDRNKTVEDWIGHGLTLAGSGGLLTEAQQVGLMRVASRKWLNRLLLGPFERLGRWGR